MAELTVVARPARWRALTGVVTLGLIVGFVLIVERTDATASSLLQIYRSLIGLGLIWIALWLVALIWIVV